VVIYAIEVMGDHEYYRQTSLVIPVALFEKLIATSTTTP
jgi:hypothetical protein